MLCNGYVLCISSNLYLINVDDDDDGGGDQQYLSSSSMFLMTTLTTLSITPVFHSVE